MKPVALVERAIRNSSKPRDTVLDCFGGSGRTMIAVERTGRRAVLLEIDSTYADVIVRRWQAAAGEAAMLEGDERVSDNAGTERPMVKQSQLQQQDYVAYCLAHARHSANAPSHAGDALQQQTETSMADHAARNKENSLAAFLAELTQASHDHFRAHPETVLWSEAASLSDATSK
jgi:hypothetical protein